MVIEIKRPTARRPTREKMIGGRKKKETRGGRTTEKTRRGIEGSRGRIK